MTKRIGYAVLIRRGGDDEISKALAEGIETVCRTQQGKADRADAIDEIARQRARKRLNQMALHRGLTESDWRAMCFDAEMAYGEPLYYPTPAEKIGAVLLSFVAMLTIIARGEATLRRRCRR